MALEDPELREQSFRPRFGSTRVSAHSPHLPPRPGTHKRRASVHILPSQHPWPHVTDEEVEA